MEHQKTCGKSGAKGMEHTLKREASRNDQSAQVAELLQMDMV